MDRTSAILACGVTYFLCGAICEETLLRLERGRIKVIPWLTGPVDQIIDAFLRNSLASLAMPGCADRFLHILDDESPQTISLPPAN